MTPINRDREDDWKLRERVTTLESEMREVRSWMVDSKSFHTEARDFFTRSDERAKQRVRQEIEEKEEHDRLDRQRSKIHFWWLGLLSALIVAGFSILLTWAISFEDRHKISSDHKAQSAIQSPVDSALPPSYQPR